MGFDSINSWSLPFYLLYIVHKNIMYAVLNCQPVEGTSPETNLGRQ